MFKKHAFGNNTVANTELIKDNSTIFTQCLPVNKNVSGPFPYST